MSRFCLSSGSVGSHRSSSSLSASCVLLSKNSSSQMRNWVVGIRDSRAVGERSIGFVLEKEPKQSRKVVQLSTLDMGEAEEGSLQQEAAAKTQEIMSPQIAAAAAAAARRVHIKISL
ncbi:unnamed protein product [Sphagnum jensenii]|uniref:Uncharacterized protein n=1 Tax=Sphagnum jensenii TaxID=128206 RepID=A0ABP0WR09_9BRYO